MISKLKTTESLGFQLRWLTFVRLWVQQVVAATDPNISAYTPTGALKLYDQAAAARVSRSTPQTSAEPDGSTVTTERHGSGDDSKAGGGCSADETPSRRRSFVRRRSPLSPDGGQEAVA